MSKLLNRNEAFSFLNENMKNGNLIKHSIATEAVMRSLARKLGHDETLWSITGLIHDIDLEQTKDDMTKHAVTAAEMLKGYDFPEDGIKAILAHNGDVLNIDRVTEFELALTCAETITGMIVATTLVYPDKKIKSVKPKSVKKRLKEKLFAKNVNRDSIMLCEKLGITIDEFILLSLEAMCEIADELGL